ncbi:hypothetical protein [Symbioplanes lichenis]|uniref:hypothetical protein n=1 Tax=Symbioplanes lichenis TaxID=1629072 RepID=UPI002739D22C|nr:hypothetical protein [Actinoplanes lichenis]
MLEEILDKLEHAVGELETTERDLPAYEMTRASFGPADSPSGVGDGLPGRVAREMRDHFAAALAARAFEAADAATRLRNLAADVRVTDEEYAATDATVAHRFQRGF